MRKDKGNNKRKGICAKRVREGKKRGREGWVSKGGGENEVDEGKGQEGNVLR